MNEYNFDVNEITEENNNTNNTNNMDSSYQGFSTDGGNKPPKKNGLLKAAATLMAMVMVSAGSIAVYRQVEPSNNKSTENTAVETVDDNDEKDSARALAAKSVSLIKTDDSTGTELSTEEIVEKVLPSVVGIESTFTVTSQGNSGYFFGFGGFEPQMPSTSEATGTGTGVVITENGYVVTNAHVIYDSEYGAGLADSISVLLKDDKSYDAEVVGYDTDCDLAVLKIDADDLTAAEFGNSEDLKLGESVIAIGNPLGFELMDTVTGGMVSGLNRSITINDKAMTLIQTDAAINSGNSGGPLINKYGQVIGINSSKMSSSYSSSGASIEGIGFAIPSNEVSDIIDDIMKYGYVTGKPQLGISCQDVTENIAKMYNLPVGIYVTNVTEDGAAEKAGLQSGDVITAVDGEEVKTSAELTAKKNLHKAGESVELTYIRNGKEHTVKVTLDEVKSEN
ncbi:MAG: trypsin-like peptidase domain-containing protein [Ruminococcus sp.]|nr:trypsin-like peptidase domain-containing protein [Ruminococcus sp.]